MMAGEGSKESVGTPFAFAADLTIIGGYLGCVWIYAGGTGLVPLKFPAKFQRKIFYYFASSAPGR